MQSMPLCQEDFFKQYPHFFKKLDANEKTPELLPILKQDGSYPEDLKLLVNHNFFHYSGSKEAYFHHFDTLEFATILVEGH